MGNPDLKQQLEDLEQERMKEDTRVFELEAKSIGSTNSVILKELREAIKEVTRLDDEIEEINKRLHEVSN